MSFLFKKLQIRITYLYKVPSILNYLPFLFGTNTILQR